MAYPNDMSRIANSIGNDDRSSAAYSATQGSKEAARNLIRREFILVKPAADAMAADTTAYTAAFQIRMTRAAKIIGAYVNPQATLTANDTNYATIKVQKGDGAGGAGTDMATLATTTTGSGNWAAGVPEVMTVSATLADTRIARGEVLGLAIAKAGSGVAVPICSITVELELEGTDAYGV